MAGDGDKSVRGLLPEDFLGEAGALRELCRLLIGEGHVAVSIFNDRFEFLHLSPAIREAFSNSLGDVEGRVITDVLPGPEGEERRRVLERVLTKGRPVMVVESFDGVPARTLVHRVQQRSGGTILVAIHRVGHGCKLVDADRDRYEVVEPRHAKLTPLMQLSPSELAVLRCIAEGMSSVQIARAIHRTVKTVEWHRARLGRKLGLKSKVELTRFAIRHGVVDLDHQMPPSDEVEERRLLGGRRESRDASGKKAGD